MLATLTTAKNFGPEEGWAFEMKWDGVRAVAYLAGGRVRLLSRKGRDESAAYPDVTAPLARLEVRDAVLDGEIVVTDASGRPGLRAPAEPHQPQPRRATSSGRRRPGRRS